jgi:GAF domain-containing protein
MPAMRRTGDRGRDEAGRLAALERYHILDTAPDLAFDRITALAATLLKAPIALTSLVDAERVWFKSRVGVELLQTDRTTGLCSAAIQGEGPYVVCDASLDPKTSDNPLVTGDFGLRFYAAAPLRTHDGYNIGALCVADQQPRQVEAHDLEILLLLAGLAMDRVESLHVQRSINEENRILHARVGELEELQDSQDRLSASLAHDLRNSLGSSSLMTKLLLEEKLGPLNSRQRQMVGSIGTTADEILLRVIAMESDAGARVASTA